MKILIFGSKSFPDISFKMNPKTGLSVYCKDSYVLNYEGIKDDITWTDMLERTDPNLGGHSMKLSHPVFPRDWEGLKKKLSEIPNTREEKDFLKAYFEWTEFGPPDLVDVGSVPALIPQPWVNWIHYDSKDEKRAKAKKTEPFRVDFLMYRESRWLIIEIDGPTHFSEILDIDVDKGIFRIEGSMKRYTEHLKKDRWLRRQGWEVWRFSNDEINQILHEVDPVRGVPMGIGWIFNIEIGGMYE